MAVANSRLLSKWRATVAKPTRSSVTADLQQSHWLPGFFQGGRLPLPSGPRAPAPAPAGRGAAVGVCRTPEGSPPAGLPGAGGLGSTQPGVGTTRSSLSGMAHYLVLTTESVTMTKAPASPSKPKPSAKPKPKTTKPKQKPKPKCKLCDKTLVPLADRRKGGTRRHNDWDARQATLWAEDLMAGWQLTTHSGYCWCGFVTSLPSRF